MISQAYYDERSMQDEWFKKENTDTMEAIAFSEYHNARSTFIRMKDSKGDDADKARRQFTEKWEVLKDRIVNIGENKDWSDGIFMQIARRNIDRSSKSQKNARQLMRRVARFLNHPEKSGEEIETYFTRARQEKDGKVFKAVGVTPVKPEGSNPVKASAVKETEPHYFIPSPGNIASFPDKARSSVEVG